MFMIILGLLLVGLVVKIGNNCSNPENKDHPFWKRFYYNQYPDYSGLAMFMGLLLIMLGSMDIGQAG